MGDAAFPVADIRAKFPALRREVDGRTAAFLDGPAGSQTPLSVIDAIGDYMVHRNANHGGLFPTSRDSDAMLARAHRAVADFLGVDEANATIFGANMTSLTFALSRSLAKTWKPGDEIVVTDLDHDANIAPWELAARDAGALVQRVRFRPEDCTLDLEDLHAKLNWRTKLVAVGAASNAVGTINPIEKIVAMAHAYEAEVFVDAVHFAPHALIDADAWDCDYLACSAYKFFGPHIGILWGRRERLEQLQAYKVRPATDELPGKWMTGTQNHECIAGTLAAIEYLADLGRDLAGNADLPRRAALSNAFTAIAEHERRLGARLIAGLQTLTGVHVYGIAELQRMSERVPTVSFTHPALCPSTIAAALGERGIFVWHGNYYALAVTEKLQLEPHGMVRIGALHYNTAEEVDRTLAELAELFSTV